MAAQFNQSSVIVGLNSYSVSVPNAAPYVMKWKISLPTIVDGGGYSSVVMTVTNTTTSTTLYTGTAGASGGSVTANCAAGDVVQFALTSANANDAGLNAVKTVVSLSQGVS